MALKGGTGIRKAYIENYRFSDDLDFTLLEKIDVEYLTEHITHSFAMARNESGIKFYDRIECKETATGSRISIYFDVIRKTSGIPLSIKIDVTSLGNENILLPLKEKNVFHLYSDNLNATVKAYSIEEMVAEKTRALF